MHGVCGILNRNIRVRLPTHCMYLKLVVFWYLLDIRHSRIKQGRLSILFVRSNERISFFFSPVLTRCVCIYAGGEQKSFAKMLFPLLIKFILLRMLKIFICVNKIELTCLSIQCAMSNASEWNLLNCKHKCSKPGSVLNPTFTYG